MIDPNLMAKIRRRAYEIWQSEGCPVGRDHIHWIRAEAEFRERLYARHPVTEMAAPPLERSYVVGHAADGPSRP
jgi:hypothetical protein